MSKESNSVDFSQYEPQLERWLRKIREEIKVSTIDDLQVLTHQLASEFKKIKKRIENIEKEITKIKKNLGESE